MKNKKILNRGIILNKLKNLGESTVENLFFSIIGLLPFAAAMTSSYYSPQRNLQKYGKLLEEVPTQENIKRRFSVLISKLKKDGLIEQGRSGKINLTPSGGSFLAKMSDRLFWNKRYVVENKKDNEQILIIFDIPEIIKKKREWLRFQLKSLDFKQLQKSVWIGESKLPREFLEDIKSINLLPYIHIFSIKKMGSIPNSR